MRVFVTGATGFIGSHVVGELISHGHEVLGLARSDASAANLVAAGAEVHRGFLEDTDCLRRGAAVADATIHVGFNVDNFAEFVKSCGTDKSAIQAIGEEIAGSHKRFLVTTGLGGLRAAAGELATEEADLPPNLPIPRVSEATALSLVEKDVQISVIRLGQIHNTVKQGLLTFAVGVARETGVSAYVGDGTNIWAAAHVKDAAVLYRLALEKFECGAKWHGIAESDVRMRDVAEAIGKGLEVPVKSISEQEASGHFGWWGWSVGADVTASNMITRNKLGWTPREVGLISDLEHMDYA